MLLLPALDHFRLVLGDRRARLPRVACKAIEASPITDTRTLSDSAQPRMPAAEAGRGISSVVAGADSGKRQTRQLSHSESTQRTLTLGGPAVPLNQQLGVLADAAPIVDRFDGIQLLTGITASRAVKTPQRTPSRNRFRKLRTGMRHERQWGGGGARHKAVSEHEREKRRPTCSVSTCISMP